MTKGMKPKVKVLVTKTIISRTFGDETLMVKAKALQQENKSGSFNKTSFFLYHLRHSLNRGALLFVAFEISPSQWQLPVGTITDCFSKLLLFVVTKDAEELCSAGAKNQSYAFGDFRLLNKLS